MVSDARRAPRLGHGTEGLSDRLRADATIAFVDMFSLGALHVASQVRLAHD
jgi:hypothetical protein